MLKKILIGTAAVILILLAFRYCEFKKDGDGTTFEESAMIQEQIKNVGKLVVTEGHYSEVITYKNKENYLGNYLSFEKKALVIVNAEATVSYDLRQVQYDIDEANKTITITNIPKEEIKISPDIKFYDIQESTFNEFTGDDYNKINAQVKASMRKKIEKSSLKTNAQNRLISELSKILILTNSMGWKLQYNGEQVNDKNIEVLL
ncbi:DUF4230 domain-containing protein [Flavobacterium sp. RHBU_3]|uniref:DUF4230 domain-containing protein n=1 Tax=Flavobacterium sp. RHBU_3 TaxID=3391184 RepID=UPI003984964A